LTGTGTFVNVLTVLIGGAIGLAVGNRLPARLSEVTMQCVGLAVVLVGLQMGHEANTGPRFIAVLVSLVAGAWVGEWFRLDDRLNQLGENLKRRFGSDRRGDFTRGFVTASLLFCVGPMAVLGSLQDGLRGDPALLLTKSTLDGISAIALAAGLGPGVLFSAAPILVYQGAITLAAGVARGFLTAPVVSLLTASGGLMIVAIGLNILQLARIRVANMLPGLAVAVAAGLLFAGVLL
jgi:uncharacterized membrane protein YqgA involved in biofilm formation